MVVVVEPSGLVEVCVVAPSAPADDNSEFERVLPGRRAGLRLTAGVVAMVTVPAFGACQLALADRAVAIGIEFGEQRVGARFIDAVST